MNTLSLCTDGSFGFGQHSSCSGKLGKGVWNLPAASITVFKRNHTVFYCLILELGALHLDSMPDRNPGSRAECPLEGSWERERKPPQSLQSPQRWQEVSKLIHQPWENINTNFSSLALTFPHMLTWRKRYSKFSPVEKSWLVILMDTKYYFLSELRNLYLQERDLEIVRETAPEHPLVGSALHIKWYITIHCILNHLKESQISKWACCSRALRSSHCLNFPKLKCYNVKRKPSSFWGHSNHSRVC